MSPNPSMKTQDTWIFVCSFSLPSGELNVWNAFMQACMHVWRVPVQVLPPIKLTCIFFAVSHILCCIFDFNKHSMVLQWLQSALKWPHLIHDEGWNRIVETNGAKYKCIALHYPFVRAFNVWNFICDTEKCDAGSVRISLCIEERKNLSLFITKIRFLSV